MNNFKLNTPVALFIFNRPETTRRVFNEIAKVKPPILLIVGDGARIDNVGERDKVIETRKIVNRINWDCKLLSNFSDENLGCKLRVSSGLNWVFEQVNEAIILEDDCLPNQSFFKFSEIMLKKYREDERIMMIAGTNYKLDEYKIETTYLYSKYFAIWGWATWKRAWNKFDITMKNWEHIKKNNHIKYMYNQIEMQKYLIKIFDNTLNNKINTWDIQWFYTCLFNNGLCILPQKNLISNIGLNGTHTTNDYSNHLLPTFELYLDEIISPELVYPDYYYDNFIIENKIDNKLQNRIYKKIKKYI